MKNLDKLILSEMRFEKETFALVPEAAGSVHGLHFREIGIGEEQEKIFMCCSGETGLLFLGHGVIPEQIRFCTDYAVSFEAAFIS